ncbi:MAG: hypothetical protein AAF705_17770 [Bacteroidota bacterium]
MKALSKRLRFGLLAIPVLLLIPFIATQFTPEVNWKTGDFVVMGALLLSCIIAIEILFKVIQQNETRRWLIVGIVLLFLLIWAELGVGIFGTPFGGS